MAFSALISRLSILLGGLAQLARAPALHAGGHRFDSDILHQEKVNVSLGNVWSGSTPEFTLYILNGKLQQRHPAL